MIASAVSEIRIKLRDAVGKVFDLANEEIHKFILVRPKVFVLDVEDSHFNFDRRVLLPDLASVDGSTPVLDTRRVTGLGVIYAALYHAKGHTAQGLFVTGHTDPSGSATYNQKLSEERAKNVSLLLRGKRDDWSKLSAQDDAVDDVQAVLTWQVDRAGWDCDPGGIDNKLGKQTRDAVGRFQELYNLEVDKATNAGLDSPFKKKIGVDKKAGAETWGAIYDLYMSELMDLLELTSYSALQQIQAALKAPSGMTDFVGCGEHIPFNPARRNPFEKGTDEHLEGPQKNPPDRRVEILFFDPGEEVSLVCHPKPGKCEPAECPVYIKIPPRENPIGIPKGLPLAEVNLKLTFVDPEGKVRPFPEGLEVEAKFGDPADDPGPPRGPDDLAPIIDEDDSDGAGASPAPPPEPTPGADPDAESMEVDQEPNEKVGDDGLLQFVIPRKASRLYLRILAGEDRCYVTADRKELDKQKLVNKEEALDDVGAGRVFFMLPREFNTQQGYFDLPAPSAGVTFKDGSFQDIDNRQTQIGERGAPLELRLTIHWQHFKFEYFDRWTSSVAQVPQPRSQDGAGKAAPPLVMEGISSLIEADMTALRPDMQTAWDVQSGKNTVHCLAWVQRQVAKGDNPARTLPDDKCTARFRTAALFVRTEGDGSSPDATRSFVTIASGDDAREKPSAERLRLYDLPAEWRSRAYPARLEGETTDKIRDFEQLEANPSTLDKPYVVSLDTIVLQAGDGKPDLTIQWNDTNIANRFALFDNQINVYKPDASGESYFTKLGDLKPQPKGPVLSDIPPFTRLIARGPVVYDVFARRTQAVPMFKGAPVGARYAVQMSTGQDTLRPATLYANPYAAPQPNATSSPGSLGKGLAAFLRCCGHDKDVELFNVIQYVNVSFDYPSTIAPALQASNPFMRTAIPFPAPPPDAIPQARDCLIKIAKRWNGQDAFNTFPTTFEIGAPVTARGSYHALLLRGPRGTAVQVPSPEIRINVLKQIRASMSGAEGYWEMSNLTSGGDGWFTAAHEFGHVFSQPDEYLNRDFKPSLRQPNISESWRSAGAPYGLDPKGMMNTNIQVRGRYFWDLLLFARDQGYFKDATSLAIKRGPRTFTADITPPDQSRVRFPAFQRSNVAISTVGLCDLFVYVGALDEFTGETIDPSATASPYDGFVVVRVKMAWDVTTTNEFDQLTQFMSRAYWAIQQRFNDPRHFAVRAKVGTRNVRLRLLFAPRFICSTFPHGGDSATYLASMDPALPQPFTAGDYTARVTSLIGSDGVHVNVRLADGAPGVHAGTPRQALVRNDGSFLLIFTESHFDDDTVSMFGQMVGSASGGAPRTGADFKPLADALVTSFNPDISSAVPEAI